jgi:hypothetical protein
MAVEERPVSDDRTNKGFVKAFASRPLDWQDVESVAVRQGGKLHWDLVEASIAPLCELKGDQETLDRLRLLRRRASG